MSSTPDFGKKLIKKLEDNSLYLLEYKFNENSLLEIQSKNHENINEIESIYSSTNLYNDLIEFNVKHSPENKDELILKFYKGGLNFNDFFLIKMQIQVEILLEKVLNMLYEENFTLKALDDHTLILSFKIYSFIDKKSTVLNIELKEVELSMNQLNEKTVILFKLNSQLKNEVKELKEKVEKLEKNNYCLLSDIKEYKTTIENLKAPSNNSLKVDKENDLKNEVSKFSEMTIENDKKIKVLFDLVNSLNGSKILTLNPSSILGSGLAYIKESNRLDKSQTSHCAILSEKSFNSGIHSWKIKVLEKHDYCGEFWIMLGVHTNPSELKAHPTGDSGVYGKSFSNNLNEWQTIAGETTNPKDNLKIDPLDIITVILDCDNGKLTYRIKTKDFVLDVPKNENLWAYFDPYDLSFEIIY